MNNQENATPNMEITFLLSANDAEKLFWAFHSGELEGLGALGVEFVPKSCLTFAHEPDIMIAGEDANHTHSTKRVNDGKLA